MVMFEIVRRIIVCLLTEQTYNDRSVRLNYDDVSESFDYDLQIDRLIG